MKMKDYNEKIKTLLVLNEKRKELAAEKKQVDNEFDKLRDEVIDLMIDNDGKRAEELAGYRITRSMRVSCSVNQDHVPEAKELSEELGFDDALTFNSPRLTSHLKALYPDAFRDNVVDASQLPPEIAANFNVWSKPTLSITKK